MSQEQKANDNVMKALLHDQGQLKYEEGIIAEKAAVNKEEQMVNKAQQKQCHYEDTLIEKKMLDEIIRNNHNEDMRELHQKQYQQARIRDEMEKSAAAQIVGKEKQKQMLLLEDKEIERQVMEKESRDRSFSDEKQRQAKGKEEATDRMAVKFLAQEQECQDRRDLITEMRHQEYVEKNHQEDMADLEKEERVRRETRETLVERGERRSYLANEVKESKERDLEFRIVATENMHAEDEKDRQKERGEREVNRQYGKDLMKQIEGNRKRKEADKIGEEARNQLDMETSENWSDIHHYHSP